MAASQEEIFAGIDSARAEGKQNEREVFEQLKAMYSAGAEAKENVELLWRLARAAYDLALTLEQPEAKKAMLFEGQGYALEAYKLRDNDFPVLKWLAALTGQITDYLGTKERIQQGNAFKEYLDKAIALNAQDPAVLHMRGRFAFNVASLSWIERKVASTLFATPPTATFEEAVADLLEAEKLRDAWLENRLYLARSYQALGNKQEMRAWLEKAKQVQATNESEKTSLAEVDALLKKC